jgi:hypothetical protein
MAGPGEQSLTPKAGFSNLQSLIETHHQPGGPEVGFEDVVGLAWLPPFQTKYSRRLPIQLGNDKGRYCSRRPDVIWALIDPCVFWVGGH